MSAEVLHTWIVILQRDSERTGCSCRCGRELKMSTSYIVRSRENKSINP